MASGDRRYPISNQDIDMDALGGMAAHKGEPIHESDDVSRNGIQEVVAR